jgi:hypothetical protein
VLAELDRGRLFDIPAGFVGSPDAANISRQPFNVDGDVGLG